LLPTRILKSPAKPDSTVLRFKFSYKTNTIVFVDVLSPVALDFLKLEFMHISVDFYPVAFGEFASQ